MAKITFQYRVNTPIGKRTKSVKIGSGQNDTRYLQPGEFTPYLNAPGKVVFLNKEIVSLFSDNTIYQLDGSFEEKDSIVIFTPYNFNFLKQLVNKHTKLTN